MKSNIPWMLGLVCAIAVLVGTSTTVRGDLFLWNGACGDQNWFTVCNGSECEPGRNWLLNNWGRLGCSPNQPLFPSITDDIQVGAVAGLWIASAAVRDVSIPTTGDLQVGNGGHLTLHGNTLVIDGRLLLHYGGYAGPGTLTLVGDTTLSGGGMIQADAAAVIDGAGPLHVLAGQTIHGQGATIHVPFDNAGVVACDAAGTSSLRTHAKTNSGILRAANGGALEIHVPVDQSGGGRLIADGGNINLMTGAAITGGTTETTGTSKIDASFQSCTLTDLHNLGDLRVGNGGLFVVNGTALTNDGLLRVYYGGYAGNGTVRFDAPVELLGSGAMELTGAVLNGSTFTHAATHTIQGSGGTLNAGFDNLGIIRAQGVGGTINIQGDAKSNQGTMVAMPDAHLNIATIVNQAGAGRILADGGTVHLNTGTVVSGGALETIGAGEIIADNQSIAMADVNNLGRLRVGNGGLLALGGTTLTNDGLIRIYYGGYAGNGTMRLDTPVELAGNGELELAGASINGAQFTQAATHSTRGSGGTINAAFVNHGLIRAEGTSGVINIQGDAKTNHGDLTVVTGAHLNIATTITQSLDGRILADGGTVHLNNGTVLSGGALESMNGGVMYVDYQTITVGDLTNRGDLRVGNGGRIVTTGATLTNDGVITTYYSGYAGCGMLRLDANLRLAGTGILRLACAGVESAVGATLTNGAGHTITGGSAIHTPLFNEGIVAPGDGVGALPVNAAYTQLARGQLRVELGGVGSCDVLSVAGPAALAGNLHIVPVNGFQPQPGQQFVVLTSANLANTFTTITGIGFYTTSYADNRVTITVVYPPADMNCDAAVNVFDVATFIMALLDPAAYQTQYPACNLMNADMNGDGCLNGADIQPFVRVVTLP